MARKPAAKPYLVERPSARLDDVSFVLASVDTLASRVPLHKAAELAARLARATPGQVAVLAAMACDAEICNGGFHQLFYNSTGILYREGVAGFERIGAHEFGRLLQKAGALLGARVPRDHKARVARLAKTPFETWNKQIRATEQRYYKLRSDKRPLERIARRYIEAHPDEFFV